MSNLLKKVTGAKDTGGLNKNLNNALAKAKHREKIIVEEKIKKPKTKKVNVSYSIDKSNDIELKKHVLRLKLEGIENDALEEISASSIVNNLLNEYLKNNSL